MNSLTQEPALLEQDRNGEALYEIVNGLRVEKAMSVRETRLGNILARAIDQSLGEDPPGEAFHEMLFLLQAEPKLQRRPDVAYVPYDRWPTRSVPEDEAWAVTPALAIEIVSKNNTATEIQTKVEEYLRHGVSVVWVIYPQQRKVHVYQSPKSIRILDDSDSLTADPVLPSFALSLREFFAHLGNP